MKELKVEEAMTTDPVTVTTDTSVTDVAKIMVDRGIGGVPVVNEQGELVGIVTEGDLIVQDEDVKFPSFVHFMDWYLFSPGALHRFDDKFRKVVAATVGDVMTEDVVTVESDDSVHDVANVMAKKNLKRFPVIKDGALVGMITMADIVKLISRDRPLEEDG